LDNFSFGLNIARFQNKPKSWPTYPWIDGEFFFFPLDSTEHNSKTNQKPGHFVFLASVAKKQYPQLHCWCVCVCVCVREGRKRDSIFNAFVIALIYACTVEFEIKDQQLQTSNHLGVGWGFFFFFISVGGSLLSSFSPTRVIGQLLKLLQKV
jgi:hypothetical protein